jgi:hypothetical protein
VVEAGGLGVGDVGVKNDITLIHKLAIFFLVYLSLYIFQNISSLFSVVNRSISFWR